MEIRVSFCNFGEGCWKPNRANQWGRKIKVSSGTQTRFWRDVWIGENALKVIFKSLYSCCTDTEIFVAEALQTPGVRLNFRRAFGPGEMGEWEDLLALVREVQLGGGRDTVLWSFEPNGKYTTRLLYKFITSDGVTDTLMVDVWKCKIPMKIQIFLWMAFRDRIQAKMQLKKRRWSGPGECKLCGQEENTGHILFQCPLACFLWIFIIETFGWPITSASCEELRIFLSKDSSSNANLSFSFIQDDVGTLEDQKCSRFR